MIETEKSYSSGLKYNLLSLLVLNGLVLGPIHMNRRGIYETFINIYLSFPINLNFEFLNENFHWQS